MNIKKTVISTLITSALGFSSISVIANEIPFKIAVIKHASGSEDIALGKASKFIDGFTNDIGDEVFFEDNMSLCAAYIKTSTLHKSEAACTAAINSLKTINASSTKAQYLKALSYSNRGVSRYLNEDIAGSMDDFTTAILIDVNTITKSNLILMKQRLMKEEVEEHPVTLSE